MSGQGVLQKDDSSDQHNTSVAEAWNYRLLICIFILSFFLQALLLPCLCSIGTAKINFAIAFDGFIALRILIAWLLKEKNQGWKFYLFLDLTSCAWIEILSYFISGGH